MDLNLWMFERRKWMRLVAVAKGISLPEFLSREM